MTDKSDANSSSPKEKAMTKMPVLQLPYCFLAFELFSNTVLFRPLYLLPGCYHLFSDGACSLLLKSLHYL